MSGAPRAAAGPGGFSLAACGWDKAHPGAASSIREGLVETLTVTRLALTPRDALWRRLGSPTRASSMFSVRRAEARNVQYCNRATRPCAGWPLDQASKAGGVSAATAGPCRFSCWHEASCRRPCHDLEVNAVRAPSKIHPRIATEAHRVQGIPRRSARRRVSARRPVPTGGGALGDGCRPGPAGWRDGNRSQLDVRAGR